MKREMQAVAVEDWNLDGMTKQTRKERLLSSISAEQLIHNIAGEVTVLCVKWCASGDNPNHYRAQAVCSLQKRTFDLFFNGRMGYRAQYYLSIEEGQLHDSGWT